MYQSTKVIDGFSVCFRQWRAKSHCSKLHGYALKFKLVFQSEDLDLNNWVADFGFLKFELGDREPYKQSNTFKKWFSHNFDHTTIISLNDPQLQSFKELEENGVIKLNVLNGVGCEAFAEYVFNFINANLHLISQNPQLILASVECIENERNSAIYHGN